MVVHVANHTSRVVFRTTLECRRAMCLCHQACIVQRTNLPSSSGVQSRIRLGRANAFSNCHTGVCVNNPDRRLGSWQAGRLAGRLAGGLVIVPVIGQTRGIAGKPGQARPGQARPGQAGQRKARRRAAAQHVLNIWQRHQDSCRSSVEQHTSTQLLLSKLP